MLKPSRVASVRRSELPSNARAALMALARMMAEAEAARIFGDHNDEMGDLRAPQQRQAESEILR